MDSKEISAEVEPKLESAIRTFKQTVGYGTAGVSTTDGGTD
jgi:hypothetical protein